MVTEEVDTAAGLDLADAIARRVFDRRQALQFHDARLEPIELLRELSLGLSHEAVPGNG